jgi:hypothetical protein
LRSPGRGTPRAPSLPAEGEESPPAQASGSPTEVMLEPAYAAALTPEQRADLRLWNGRVTVLDRVKAMRGYALVTLAATVAGIGLFVFGVTEVPPFVVAPIVPIYMWRKLWLRGRSLRETGLQVRQMFPRPHLVIRRPSTEQQLEKLAPRAVLDSPEGAVIRRAVEDRSAILQLFAKLSKADRGRLPDLTATVKLLVERVAHLASTLHRLDGSIDPSLGRELDGRIAIVEHDGGSPEGERRLALLRRQRGTLDELVDRRTALARQLDSAGLALGNLRLDLVKLQSSGLQSAFADVSSATQEARALSSEIDAVLAAAAEVRSL